MGFFDWLLGTPKKRRGTGAAKRASANTGGTSAPRPAGPARSPRRQEEPPGKQVLKSEKESSQARDIVRDWMKDES